MDNIQIFVTSEDYDEWIDSCENNISNPAIIIHNDEDNKSISYNYPFIDTIVPAEALVEFLKVFGNFADIAALKEELAILITQGFVTYSMPNFQYYIERIDNNTLGFELTVTK